MEYVTTNMNPIDFPNRNEIIKFQQINDLYWHGLKFLIDKQKQLKI